MRVVLDIEADGLNPTKIWVIVCKDIDSGAVTIFRRVSDDPAELAKAKAFLNSCTEIAGHNILEYDVAVCRRLLGCSFHRLVVCHDTLIISRLVDYSRDSHSLESYGLSFGLPKIDFSDYSQYSEEMEVYCVRDVQISELLYLHFLPVISDPEWAQSIQAEHEFQLVVNDLHDNGFGFDVAGCTRLLGRVEKELKKLDEAINVSFPRRLKLLREVHPVRTQHGTLNRKDFRWLLHGDLSEFNGGPFCRLAWEDFNPSSHKQIVSVLHSAGWKPTERTATAVETQRKLQRIERNGENVLDKDIKALYDKKQSEEKYGWKINETNLATLPPTAPLPARSLARRILIESRRRTLTEWLGLVSPSSRIHGKFYGIGAWTHRMAHQAPNTANIPNGTDTQGKERPYGAEMRSLWCAPPGRLLVGVDAEGIQLRIFAHYINDTEFTEALVNGDKARKTDPHSLNQRVLGSVCKSRAAAKRFIYALLLGAGIGKLSEVLECSQDETKQALDRLLQRYEGWKRLKSEVIPFDAERGYFVGLDGRKVKILGNETSQRRHLAMSGYLQNGEAVVMKHATLRWHKVLRECGIEFKLVNLVHDEWQTECADYNAAFAIAQAQADSLVWVGQKLGLRCPLAGSYWNDDLKDYTIGKNWKETH